MISQSSDETGSVPTAFAVGKSCNNPISTCQLTFIKIFQGKVLHHTDNISLLEPQSLCVLWIDLDSFKALLRRVGRAELGQRR